MKLSLLINRPLLFCTLLFVSGASHQPDIRAQELRSLHRPVGGRMENTIAFAIDVHLNGAGVTWRSDPDRKLIAVQMANYVMISLDSGKTFRAADIPVKRAFWGNMTLAVADSTTIYVSHRDLDQPSWTIVSKDRGKSWDSIKLQGQFLLAQEVRMLCADGSFLARQASPNGGSSPKCYISTNYGKTWSDSSVQNLELGSSSVSPWVFDTMSQSLFYWVGYPDPVLWSRRDGNRKDFGVVRFPQRTSAIYRFGRDTFLVQQIVSVGKYSDAIWLLRSTDASASWIRIDTIVIAGTKKALAWPPKRAHILMSDGQSSATFWMAESGHLVATSDAGATWYSRGQLPGYDRAPELGEFTTVPGKHILIPVFTDTSSLFATLRIGTTDPVEFRASPVGVPYQVSDSIFLMATIGCIMRSTDGAKSWYILGEEIQGYTGIPRNESPDVMPLAATSLWWGWDNRLWQDARWQVTRSRGAVTLQFDQSYIVSYTHPLSLTPRWFHRKGRDSDTLDAYSAISESNFVQPFGRPPSPVRGRISRSLSGYDYKTVTVVADSLRKPQTLVRRRAHFIRQTRSGVLMMAADSMLVSTDTARTWKTVSGKGLPYDSTSNLPLVTAFAEGPFGEWYVGLSGRVLLDSSRETGREPGGVYRSLDSGQSWQPVGSFDGSRHITHLQCDGTGRLYALATDRSYDLARDPAFLEQDYMSVLYHVADARCEELFRDFYSGPVLYAPRSLSRDQQGAILYGSLSSGLMRTSDVGQTWQTIGTGTLDTLRICAVVVDTNNRYYIGTSRGVFVYDGLATGIEQRDQLKCAVAGISASPSPAGSHLTVTVRAADASAIGSAITIFDAQGRSIRRIPTSGFDASAAYAKITTDVSDLPTGLYYLTLTTPTTTAQCRVVVAR